MLRTWLGKKGFQAETAGSVTAAKRLLEKTAFDLILSDLRLPDDDGITLLPWKKEQGIDAPLIIMTSYADIQNAVLAMKEGASDYVSKPIKPDLLLQKINDALANGSTADNDVAEKPATDSADDSDPDFLEGESEAARKLYSMVSLVAPTQMSVLINGASGTGKEYVAHRIHRQSKRADKPFVAIDCGSIPKELAASEFFGHVKGSFTGALADKTGAFVEANGGTLFLDEVGNLSYEVQVQLLRALQERKVRPVGATLLAADTLIHPRDFADGLTPASAPADEAAPQAQAPASLHLRNSDEERERIIEALQQTKYNKSKAAQLLGVDRKTLYNKIKQYGL